jgi:hypothetical protein
MATLTKLWKTASLAAATLLANVVYLMLRAAGEQDKADELAFWCRAAWGKDTAADWKWYAARR